MTRLKPCPGTPNCLSTRSPVGDRSHAEPWPYTGTPAQTRDRLLAILRDEGLEIRVAEDDYIHAVHTSRLLRFKDDVEFEIDAEEHQVHYRSASRTGHWDLGANGRRMDGLRRAFET